MRDLQEESNSSMAMVAFKKMWKRKEGAVCVFIPRGRVLSAAEEADPITCKLALACPTMAAATKRSGRRKKRARERRLHPAAR
jgi:hypothetical protein